MAYSELEKALLQKITETAKEMTTARTAATDVIATFKFLREASGGAFLFDERPPFSGDIILNTNLRTATPENLYVMINTRGEVSTNDQTDNSSAPAAAPTGNVIKLEAGDMRLDALKQETETETEKVQSRAKTALLVDIAQKAVLQDMFPLEAVAAVSAMTPENDLQKALIKGLCDAAEEVHLSQRASDAYFEGLTHLKKRSRGKLSVSRRRLPGSSDTEIKISAKNTERFQPVFIKTTSQGRVWVSTNQSYSGATEYDALEEATLPQILKDIAKTAVFKEQVPRLRSAMNVSEALLAAVTGERDAADGNADVVRQAVLDGIREATEEMATARSAATELIKGLKFVESLSGGNMTVGDMYDDQGQGRVVLRVKLQGRPEVQITVDAAGDMKIDHDQTERSAWNDNDVKAVLEDFAQKAVLLGHVPAPRARKAGGPS